MQELQLILHLYIFAMEKGHLEICKMHLDAGADPNLAVAKSSVSL